MNTISQVRSQPRAVAQPGVIHFILGMVLSALSGVMLLLSFPPYGIWPLAWVALVPSVIAQYRLLPKKWSSLAVALYILFWLGPYMGRLFGTDFGPIFTYLGVLIAILQLFIATERKFHEMTKFRYFVLFGVFGWVGFEMVRAEFIPLVATSAFIGYTQATQAWLFQPVSIFSVYSFNLLIITVNYVLGQGLLAWYDRKYQSEGVPHVNFQSTNRWMVGTGIVLVTWIGLSLIMLNSTPKAGETVRVAALRSGFPEAAHLDKANTDQIRFDRFAEQAQEAVAQGAEVLFTSEMMFNFDPQVKNTEEFRAIAKETNTYIFIAYSVMDPFRNETVLLSPSGEFSAVYAKNHNTPGEPLSPGAGVYPVYDTPWGTMATLICHDANYTDVTRKLSANGGQLIAAGFREFGGYGEQLWTNATFRAVENRTAIVVTSAAHVSAIIDQNGRQIALEVTDEASPLVMVGDVQLGSGPTFYTSTGDVLGWVSLAGFVFFIFYPSVASRRTQKNS